MLNNCQEVTHDNNKLIDTHSSVSAVVALELIDLPEEELRYTINEEKLARLVETVKKLGLIEPLIVKPKGVNKKRFEIIAGCRRYRAAKEAGLSQVPVIIRELSDAESLETSIAENLQREDLNSFEETEAILKLLGLRLDVSPSDVPGLLYRIQNQLRDRNSTNNVIGTAEIAKVQNFFTELGLMSMDSFINNRLPMLSLPPEILEALRQGLIAYTKAVAISRLQDENQRKNLLNKVIQTNMSLSNIKKQIKDLTSEKDSEESLSSVTLKKRISSIYNRIKQSKVLDNHTKRERIEELVCALEDLLVDAN
jgi:ParB family chromosome partitioning protein